MNQALTIWLYPTLWKKTRVVLIKKPGKKTIRPHIWNWLHRRPPVILAEKRRCEGVTFKIQAHNIGQYQISGRTSGFQSQFHASVNAAEQVDAQYRLIPGQQEEIVRARRVVGHTLRSSGMERGTEQTTKQEKTGSSTKKVVLRICSAYRTVSEAAALVVAELPPIDLVMTHAQSFRVVCIHTKSDESTP